jgi:hypothetical protein
MDFRKKFLVPPGGKVKLADIDPAYKGKHESHQAAASEIARHVESLAGDPAALSLGKGRPGEERRAGSPARRR